MADIRPIDDIDFDEGGNTNNGGDTTPTNGETSNGGDIPNEGSNNTNLPDESFATTYNIYVKSDIFEASVLVNGEDIYQFIPYTFQVTKEELFTGGPITIEAKCEGYTNNEKYILSLEFLNDSGDNPPPLRVDDEVVGLSTSYLRVDYYNGSELRQINTEDAGTNSRNLEFSFERRLVLEPPTKLNTFIVNYSGVQNGAKVIKNGSFEFFPETGQNYYSDVFNTDFLIQSTNPSLYRISRVSISKTSSPREVFTAEKDESLSITIKLDSNYTVSIDVELIPEVVDWVEPRIQLLNQNIKPYNINSNVDFPILLIRNSAVTGVTVIVGSNVYEFNNIPNTRTFGVEIPSTAFEQIGNYTIRVVPFLLSEGRPQKPTGDNVDVVDISLGSNREIIDDVGTIQPLPPPKDDFTITETTENRTPDNKYNEYLSKGNNVFESVTEEQINVQ